MGTSLFCFIFQCLTLYCAFEQAVFVSEETLNSKFLENTTTLNEEAFNISLARASLDWDIRPNNNIDHYQGRMCPQRCTDNGTEWAILGDEYSCLKCFPCTCSVSCATEGTCCPRLSDHWLQPDIERAQCKSDFLDKKSVLHVVACDPNFQLSATTRRLCEKKSSSPRRRDTVLPVTSTVTNVTYANIHCAACNFDDDSVTEWGIACRHNQFLYDASSYIEYDDRAIQMPEICDAVKNSSIDDHVYHSCDPNFYNPENVVSSCNVTGQWMTWNEEVRHACEESNTSRRALVTSVWQSQFYSNAMCAVCNGEEDAIGHRCHQITPLSGSINGRTNSRLLNTKRPVDSKTKVAISAQQSCSPRGQWFHPQGECRNLSCAAGKHFVQELGCSTIVKHVRGLGYRIKLLLKPVKLGLQSKRQTTTTINRSAAEEDDSNDATINVEEDFGSSAHDLTEDDSFDSSADLEKNFGSSAHDLTEDDSFDSSADLEKNFGSSAHDLTEDDSFDSSADLEKNFGSSAHDLTEDDNFDSSAHLEENFGYSADDSFEYDSYENSADLKEDSGYSAHDLAEDDNLDSSAHLEENSGYNADDLLADDDDDDRCTDLDEDYGYSENDFEEGNSNDNNYFHEDISSYERNGCNYANSLKTAMEGKFSGKVKDKSMRITTVSTLHGTCFAEVYGHFLEKLMTHENATRLNENTETIELDIAHDIPDEAKFLTAEIEAHFIAYFSIDRDCFEESIIDDLLHSVWIIPLGKWLVELKPLDISTNLLHGGNEQSNFNMYGVSDVDTKTVPYVTTNKDLLELENLFLPLSAFLVCPHLSFHSREFEMETTSEVKVVFPLYLDSDMKPVSFEVKAHSDKVRLTEDGQLVMCIDTIQAVFPQNVTVVVRNAVTPMLLQILSVVCGSISVACLAMMLFTYALFSELRTLPGLNNMGLSSTLATAQLSLLIPWHRTHDVNICRAVGLFTHWAWLLALSWMGVCCSHMVRVFTAKTHRAVSQRGVKKAFLHNIIATVLLSTSIVVITVVVSSAVSGGTSMGYGGEICFLDMSYHQLLCLAFLLPLAVLVTFNVICFIITVVAILRVGRLQTQVRQERRDVLVYAKLATVTGGAWLLGLLAELTDEEWMRVVAELCTAAQGLLLFLAYVINARVWRLYLHRFNPQTIVSTGVTITGPSKST